jgi:prolyl-tRNA editing enzyme YbaK/EbsC (Cys-tRNA(Pro) deacylase)
MEVTELSELTASAQKVQDALKAYGVGCQVVEMPASTRTAQDAAQALGCEVAQIAKSLVFQTKTTHRPILVIASGAHRVNEKRLAEFVGEPVERASADFVREQTGFAIGGVPPVGHAHPLQVFLDEDLLRHEATWAAAGTPYAVFRLTPAELDRITIGCKRISVA